MNEPQAPQLTAKTYLFAGGAKIPCLESYDEITALLEEAGPGDFIEVTIAVQQAEATSAGEHPLFALVGISVRDGYTRARYRENIIGGYVEVLPPANPE